MLVFNGDIKFSYRSILCFWKVSIFGGIVFFYYKITFYAKSLSFWANEWISKYSDKIMSCKLWGKVTSVSVNIYFGEKNVNFEGKKINK